MVDAPVSDTPWWALRYEMLAEIDPALLGVSDEGAEAEFVERIAELGPGARILDVGCGEGVLTHEWAGRLGDGRIVGVDLDDPLLSAQWQQRQAPNLEYRVMKGERLDFADNEFDTASAIEVLEHVSDPEMVLSEMARCAERWIIVSVPREPLWRITNVARGAYWRELGNTPGHVNHWSSNGFRKLLSRYGTVVELRHPFPWTMSVVRLGD